jgi:stalled ribosome alternative rescue factor ArfA
LSQNVACEAAASAAVSEKLFHRIEKPKKGLSPSKPNICHENHYRY